MPTPHLSTVTLTGTYYNYVLDAPSVGTVTIESVVRIVDIPHALMGVPQKRVITLDAAGSFSTVLPATDDSDFIPTFQYKITEFMDGKFRDPFYILLPAAAPNQDLSSIAPVDPTSPNSVYVLPTISAEPIATAHISNPTAAHAATAISVSPSGNISSTNVGAALNELDSEKAPLLHAANHASGGSDPITIIESQVTGLVSDLAAKQATGNYITALTGPITASGPGSAVTVLSTNAVDNTQLADMAQATFKMREAGAGTGDPIDGTPTQAKTALAIANTDVSGLGTASTANTGTTSGTIPVLGTGGVLAIARLATGTPDGTKFVRDDGTLVTPASGSDKLGLTPVAVKTANYTAAAGDLVPCDTSGGAFAITFPTAPADGTVLAIKLVTAGNTLTLTLGGSDVFNKAGGSASGSLTLANQGILCQYKASGAIWFVVADDLSKSSLDALYAPLASPALTGTPTAPTAAQGTNTTQLATTAMVHSEAVLLAPLASPTLTGTPAAPTAAQGTNTTQIATTAMVHSEAVLLAPLASPALTGTPTVPTGSVGDNSTKAANTAFVYGERAPRVTTITSSATPTFNTDTADVVHITALAAAITSMVTNKTGTPGSFQKLLVRIKDDGTPRAITWGADYEACGVALPTTTVASKRLTVGLIWGASTSKWGCVAVAQEA